ncbi:MAG: sugar ABC transporter permease [Eubacteriales bacterium]
MKRKKKKELTYANFYYYLLLIAPLAIIYIVFFVTPVVQSMFYSFTNFNGLQLQADFVGLKNYKVAIQDSKFIASIKNTIWLAIGVTVIQNILSIAIALGLNLKFKGRGIVRTLIFAPCMLAPVVVAYVWQFIYTPDGLLDKIFPTDIVWLANPNYALMCVIVAHTWIWLGYTATIYLASLQDISTDIKEAAAIDGSSGWQLFRHITFPLMAPAVTINVSLAFTGSLKIFDLVYAMTGGGPNGATETMGTYVMSKMSSNLHGYASALSVIMMVMIIISGRLLITYLHKREEAMS